MDGTLVQGPVASEATHKFRSYWQVQRDLVGSLLVYNTGRERGSLEHVVRGAELPVPDVVFLLSFFCFSFFFFLLFLLPST